MNGMSKKHILIIAAVFIPEPIVSAHLLADLAEELSKDYIVTILRPRPSRPLGFKHNKIDFNKYPYNVVTLDSYCHPKSELLGRFKESYSMGRAACKYISEHHNEIDFIYNDPWHLFGVDMVARKAVKYGIPYVTPVQDIYPESITSKLPNISLLKFIVIKLLMPFDSFRMKHASAIHTISPSMAEWLCHSRKIPIEKFIVVRNWQDERPFISFKSSSNEDQNDALFTFMYLGNVGKLAGLDVVLDAWKEVGEKSSQVIIAGAGADKQRLEERCSLENIQNIFFIDVPDGKVVEIQSKADVMLLPVQKGFALSSIPSKLPAYMFSAKPILASIDELSDTAKCIKEANAGWIVTPENKDVLAKQMKECINISKTKLKEMGKDGQTYALNHMSRTQGLKKLSDAIRNLI